MRTALFAATVLFTLTGIATAQADVVQLDLDPSREVGGVTILNTKTIVTATVSSSQDLGSAGLYIEPLGGTPFIMVLNPNAAGQWAWTFQLYPGLDGLYFHVTPFAFDREGELLIGATTKAQIQVADLVPIR